MIAVTNFRMPPAKRDKLRRLARAHRKSMTKVIVDLIDNAPEPEREETSAVRQDKTAGLFSR